MKESIQSIIDKKRFISIDNRQSIIDITLKIKSMVGDETLGEKYIEHAVRNLGIHNVINIAEYVALKGRHPGRAFIGLCEKEMNKAV